MARPFGTRLYALGTEPFGFGPSGNDPSRGSCRHSASNPAGCIGRAFLRQSRPLTVAGLVTSKPSMPCRRDREHPQLTPTSREGISWGCSVSGHCRKAWPVSYVLRSPPPPARPQGRERGGKGRRYPQNSLRTCRELRGETLDNAMSEHIPTGEATEANDAATISIAMKTSKPKKQHAEPAAIDGARHMPISELSFGANTRETSGLDSASIKELAASIRERGVMQPITVRRVLHGFEIVAGTRRVLASQTAGLTTIPAIIIDADETESLVLNIIENVQRENLSLHETAKAVRQMLAVFGKPVDVSRKLGKSKAWVSKHMALTSPSFNAEVKSLMDDGACNDVELLNALNQVAKQPNGGSALPSLIAGVREGRVGRGHVRDVLEGLKAASDASADDDGQVTEGEESTDPTGPATITFKLSPAQAQQFEALGGAAWLRRQLKKLAKAAA